MSARPSSRGDPYRESSTNAITLAEMLQQGRTRGTDCGRGRIQNGNEQTNLRPRPDRSLARSPDEIDIERSVELLSCVAADAPHGLSSFALRSALMRFELWPNSVSLPRSQHGELVGWLVWSASFSTGDVLPPLLLLLLWRGAVVVARGK